MWLGDFVIVVVVPNNSFYECILNIMCVNISIFDQDLSILLTIVSKDICVEINIFRISFPKLGFYI